jgi:poly-gamma-glutamate synthesis protein (capsule biosynthesis protein)
MAPLRIVVTADICPNEGLAEELMQGDPRRFVRPFEPLFDNADLVLGNLETPLVDAATPIPKTGPNFITPTAVLPALRTMGFDGFTLCNNHTNDQGNDGLAETLRVLDAAGVPHCGAGMTHEEASAPMVFERQGKRIAIFNFGEGEFAQAQDDGPGAARLDAFWQEQRVAEAAEAFDVVLVVLHVGNEYEPIPSTVTTDFCRRFASAGADAVIAHHAHIPQADEVFEGTPICFSLGNFLFGYPRTEQRWGANPCWFLCTVAEIVIDEDGYSLTLHPSWQGEDRAHHALSPAGRKAFDEYLARCRAILADTAAHRRFWDQEARDLFKGHRRNLAQWSTQLASDDESVQHRAATCLYNVFRCDAHHAAVQQGLRLMYEGRLGDDPETVAELASLRELIKQSFA